MLSLRNVSNGKIRLPFQNFTYPWEVSSGTTNVCSINTPTGISEFLGKWKAHWVNQSHLKSLST